MEEDRKEGSKERARRGRKQIRGWMDRWEMEPRDGDRDGRREECVVAMFGNAHTFRKLSP